MWSDTNITPEDIEELGEYDESGNLKRHDGEIWKRQTFADVLGDNDIKEPYEIATTEW